MEGDKKIPKINNNISNNKIINNSILEYYSDYINLNAQNSISELQKIKSINFPQKSNIQIPNKISDTLQDNSSNKFCLNEKYYKSKNNNYILKNEILNDNTEKQKEIKKLSPDDLILIKMENRTILRVNPIRYINESYEFLSNNLYILLKDQLGCKFLQEKLEKDTYNAFNYFLPALIPNINELIKDTFANYFIQKIFIYLNEAQIEYILKILQPDFLDICIDNRGSRVIQSIMDLLITEKLKKLFFDIIKPIYINLINDFSSAYIIYKFINLFPDYLEESNNIIINNIVAISINKKGCIFLKNYISNINSIKTKNELIQTLLKNCLILIIDLFGNYIIQYLISLEDSNISLNIINQIINNISFYCKHKYSSYVIDKIFIHANYNQKQRIIQKLSSFEIISDLIFDKQGNFVILNALNYANKENKNLILKNIDILKNKLNESPHGKKFLYKISKFENFK